MTVAPAGQSERALITNACWRHHRFREKDIRGAIVTRMFFSQFICFQPGGRATGVTVAPMYGPTSDALEGFDWDSQYKIANHTIFLDGEVFGHILDVNLRRMIIGGLEGDPRTYRLVRRGAGVHIQHFRPSCRFDN
jgi:hypothetical protein